VRHLLLAAVRPVITNNTKTNYWLVFITAAAASVLGAFVGAWFAGRNNRSLSKDESKRRTDAENAQWLRERRADIYVGIFAEFQTWVNERTEALRDMAEPHVNLDARVKTSNAIQNMDDVFLDLRRQAIAASSEDGRMVSNFEPEWTTIKAQAAAWTEKKGTRGNADWSGEEKPYHDKQLESWERGCAVLQEYDRFLEH
jgi:hypothetical protein